MKRRPLAAGVTPALKPALPSASTMMAKSPALREFITATTYEDGTPREPGYFTLRNRGFTFELTVYDPDSGTRLAVRAPKIDDVLSMTEQLLGVEEAPWEQDRYLTEQLEGRKKGKRK